MTQTTREVLVAAKTKPCPQCGKLLTFNPYVDWPWRHAYGFVSCLEGLPAIAAQPDAEVGT